MPAPLGLWTMNNPVPMPKVRPPAPAAPPAPKAEELQQVIIRLEEELERQRDLLASAAGEARALNRRIQKLKDTWPAVYQDFFTTAGDRRRSEGKHLKTQRKKK